MPINDDLNMPGALAAELVGEANRRGESSQQYAHFVRMYHAPPQPEETAPGRLEETPPTILQALFDARQE